MESDIQRLSKRWQEENREMRDVLDSILKLREDIQTSEKDLEDDKDLLKSPRGGLKRPAGLKKSLKNQKNHFKCRPGLKKS